MRIRSVVPVAHQGDGAYRTLARFDCEIGDIRLNEWTLKRAPDGAPMVFAPNARGRKVATLNPITTHQLAKAALAALQERCADEPFPCR